MGNTEKTKKEDRFDTSKPQFRKHKEKSSKVVLDDRFASVLTDPRFQLDVKDKYGRKKNKKRSKEELSAFYTVEDKEEALPKRKEEPEESSSSPEHSEKHASDSSGGKRKSERGEKVDKSNEDLGSRIAYLTALSRGEVDVSSSSDEHDSSDDSSDSDDDLSQDGENDVMIAEGKSGILDPAANKEDVELTHEESPYMAVLNMDWSHVRAVDIFSIVSSFTPPGAVKRVRVFPSDFGKERLAKDALFGPVDVWKNKKKKDNKVAEGEVDGARFESSEEDSDQDEDDKRNLVDHESDVSDDDEDDHDDESITEESHYMPKSDAGESDFDMEKLRAYEASKLKYYFAVVEFSCPEYADIAYKEVDGMEFEHSSAAMDLRSIPVDGLQDAIKNRELRDEATSIPSNYDPPEFVVCALQQSSVQCTWDLGDRGRESALTKYTAGQAWGEMAEGDDLKAYLASDVSSSDDESVGENEKASRMRKMLGLDSDDDDEGDELANKKGSSSEDSSQSEEDEARVEAGTKEVSFIPGKTELEGPLDSEVEAEEEKEELTPWEKYQEKRKQKRREKRQAARAKRKEVNEIRKRGPKKSSDRNDVFFLDGETKESVESRADDRFSSRQTKAELELLVAGDDNDEEARDFDMRGLERIEKNKDKKLRGARKRKEAKLAENVSGTDFKINVVDNRFKAVLDGADDRFGIDRTDPNFKETSAMREILAEQSRRRKKKRKTKATAADTTSVARDVSAESTQSSSGTAALSALVKSIKSKVK